MRISRRSLAAAVVLGTTVVACMEAEHLSTTAQKAVVFINGTSYDFGLVQEFSGSATNPDPYFIIRAQGSSDIDWVNSVQLKSSCGSDFGLDMAGPTPFEVYCDSTGMTTGGFAGGSITPMGCTYVDYKFGALFHPSQVGSQSCEVDVTIVDGSNGSGSGSVTPVFLYGSGFAASYSFGVSPPGLDFGDVPLNMVSGAQTFAVLNNGGQPITVTGVNSDTTHFQVTPLPDGPFALALNGFQSFQVRCTTGTMPQVYSAMVTFTSAATQGSVTHSISLKCNAAATSIAATPNPVDLGTHLLGDGGSMVSVSLMNTSVTTATVTNFRFSGTPGSEVTYPSNPGTLMIGTGLSANVTVAYNPTSERDFGPLGTMMFDVNGTPTSVPLTGGAHMGSIGTNPAALDFGAVCAGSTSSLDLAVFANAGGDVKLAAPTGPGAPFSATLGSTPPVTLTAHHTNEATVTTTAAPAANAMAGDATATLQLMTNIPGESMVPISVHALVLAGGVAPDRSIVHFGPNDLGKPSPVQMVSLTNCGSTDLTLTDASLGGSNSDEFAIVSPADVHVTIPKTKSQQFLIVMNPKTAGEKTAEVDFSYAGGTSTVALDGTGIGAVGTGGTKDRETYYACSTGTPGGLAPAAFAALLVRRRRRRR